MTDRKCTCNGWKAHGHRLRSSVHAAEQYGFAFDIQRIQYCPFCGRKLVEVKSLQESTWKAWSGEGTA